MEQKKIKIVFAINDLLSGGAQRQCIDIAKHIDKDQFEIIFITLFQFPTELELYDEVPPEFTVYRFNFSSFWDIKNWWKLYRLLSQIQPNIVSSNLFFSNTVFRLLKPLVGYICIATEHNTYTNKSPVYQMIDRILSHITFRIVAVSNTVASFTSKQEGIPLDRFTVIHNGVDLKSIQKRLLAVSSKDDIKKELGFSPTDKIVLNVARLMEQKNHKLLIEAFAVFSSLHPDHKLIIVGPGPLHHELEHLITTLHMNDKIYLVGGKKDVIPYYAASDFFVLTSHIEGFALVGIEAMICGLPLVSTKTAGPDEYIMHKKNGFLIEGYSVENVVAGMEYVSLHREELIATAQETAERYDIGQTAEHYETLFKTSLKTRV